MQPVLVQDIPKHWGFVEQGLREIIRRTGEKWTPTHVLQYLNEQRAFLFVSEDGFVVLQPQREDWTSAPYTHVWAMWFAPGMAKAREREIRDWLDQVAGKNIRMGSPRRGWERALGPGWEVERVIYRRKA